MAQSYSNPGGQGDRRGLVRASVNAGDNPELVDGDVGAETGVSFPAGADPGVEFLFDFNVGRIVDEIRLYFFHVDLGASFTIQGSNNGSDWTTLGSSGSIGGTSPVAMPFSNSTKYRYYRLVTTEDIGGGAFLNEFEFQINSVALGGTTVLASVTRDNSTEAQSSLDGIDWTSRTIPGNTRYGDVAWSPELGLFAAIPRQGTVPQIATSPDGVNWTSRVVPVSNIWTSVVWAAGIGLFVAVSSGGTQRVMTSPDGITWTLRDQSINLNFIKLAWGEGAGLLIAAAASGGTEYMSSPDGINWTTRNFNAATGASVGLGWSEQLGLFVKAGTGSFLGAYETSPDGINWTSHEPDVSIAPTSVAFSKELGIFCAVGRVSPGVMISSDGADWFSKSADEPGTDYEKVIWSSVLGLFVAVAINGTNRIMTSPDGCVWTGRDAVAAREWWGVASAEADVAIDTLEPPHLANEQVLAHLRLGSELFLEPPHLGSQSALAALTIGLANADSLGPPHLANVSQLGALAFSEIQPPSPPLPYTSTVVVMS
jgi:hypothetical protein